MTVQPTRFCEQCGARLEVGVRFCEECGAQVPLPSAPPPAPVPVESTAPSPSPQSTRQRASPPEVGQPLTWETNISLLTNPLVVRQLILVVVGSGLFMALLLSFVFGASGEFDMILPMLRISALVTAGLGVLVFLITVIVFGGRIRVRFTMNEEGVLWETVGKRAITGSRLAILTGVLARSPQVAGAGALAASRQREFVAWQDVAAAELDRRHSMITLRNSWRPIMLVVGVPESFDRVVAYAQSRVTAAAHRDAIPAPRPRSRPLWNGLGRTILVALAVAPLFALSGSYFFALDLLLPLILLMFALATVWLIPLFGWVVIGCAAILAIQLALGGLADFDYLYAEEQVALLLAYIGLGYLVWFSWGSLRGRIRPPLMEN